MLRLRRVDPTAALWSDRATYDDRLIFHTRPWLRFVAEAQGASPVLAVVEDGRDTVGHFTGLVSRRFGLRILGSPMAGWTTSYMGFLLQPGISRRAALEALTPFAFDDLGCAHVEIRDRHLTPGDLDGLALRWDTAPTAVISLTPTEDELFAAMTSACRRNIRKAGKSGIVIEEASPDDPSFAAEFYDQLRDVFAKQNLVPTYSIDRVRSLMSCLGPSGNLLLLRARDTTGRCVATAVLPWHHRTMYFWGGASYRADQLSRPNEALIWHALRWARTRSLTEFDFVGGNTYKAKYGTTDVPVPWARRSRSPLVARLRDTAKQGFALKQRATARLIRAR
ncbi:GNAT family N-acetyltransferase [Actinoplanes sp. NPDC048796]|uniref:GNAT family N-acetyltransferase n=1 Tax=Actinoplanes sp. NPDC048796 TaxID=3155640 RepID=UPI003402BB43